MSKIKLLFVPFFITAFCLSHAAPTARLTGSSCASADCADTSTFCNSALECEPITYSRYPISEGAAGSGSTSFDIVMATDVQLYFTNCKNEPLGDCIFTGVRPRRRESVLITATENQVDCITTLVNAPDRDVKAIFNNGDITNGGTQEELDDVITYFHQPVSNLGIPMIVGLGNHDYANTIPAEPERKRMIDFLASSIDTLTSSGFKIRSIDWQVSPTIFNHHSTRSQDEVHNQGSFSYSFEINQYVFIVLHWSTGLPTGRYRDYFSAPGPTFEEYYDVTNVEDYLRAELISATNDGKSIILVPHTWRGLEKFINNRGLDTAIEAAPVVAILAGHDHDQWGLFKNVQYGATNPRTVPVYYAGSTSYQRLIAAKFDAGGSGITVDVYDTSSGSSCSTTGADVARFVIPEFDELKIELNGSNRVLSLCDVKAKYGDNKFLESVSTTQSSEGEGPAENALEDGLCSMTQVGEFHYWTARFRKGYSVKEIILEGNELVEGGLAGAKVMWTGRMVGKVGISGSTHVLKF